MLSMHLTNQPPSHKTASLGRSSSSTKPTPSHSSKTLPVLFSTSSKTTSDQVYNKEPTPLSQYREASRIHSTSQQSPQQFLIVTLSITAIASTELA